MSPTRTRYASEGERLTDLILGEAFWSVLPCWRIGFVWLAGLSLLTSVELSADVIKLKDGGEIRGTVKPVDPKARREKDAVADEVVIESLTGAEIVVARQEVVFITKRPRNVEEYESQARRVDDTVEARWQLAEWCRKHGLTEARKEQLSRILELDPEHKPAHYGLAHRRQGNTWITPEEADAELLAAGYVRYKGRLITTLERELLENGATRQQEQNEWRPKIRLWLGWLNGRDATRRADAVVKFRELRDHDAIPAIVDFLLSDANAEIRRLAVQTLAQMEGTAAVPALVRVALSDAEPSLQSSAFQALPEEQRAAAVPFFQRALRDESNLIVRRASVLLGRCGVRQAVPTLIEALATSHKIRVPQGPAYAASFNRNGSMAGSGSVLPPEVEAAMRAGQLPYGVVIDNSNAPAAPVKWVTVLVPLQNAEALDALRTLTQQNFGFDKRAWRLWWQAQM
ncbi:MAG: HEAT repeat domain-containing protein [Planctomycetaceae bacterium]|nr:HEAT repeat domain-containing protein [Planctomycetaceae bacterium]